jgi:hypothetical protein
MAHFFINISGYFSPVCAPRDIHKKKTAMAVAIVSNRSATVTTISGLRLSNTVDNSKYDTSCLGCGS